MHRRRRGKRSGRRETGINGNQSDDSAFRSGAAYVFVRNGNNWTQQAYLKASNTGPDDNFGWSAAISGDALTVGALAEDSVATGLNGDANDNSASGAGAAYHFVRRGANWNQQAYLKASNTEPTGGDYFGSSVGVSGDTVLVGAPFDRSSAIGVNGDQNNNWAGESGAAYVFTGLGNGPRLALVPDDNGGYFIRFTGAPGVTYRLESSRYVDGGWDTLAWLTAPATGFVEYHDWFPPLGQGFYRTAQP